jgi:thiol-disulfide isomerase/thioredoxin
MTLKLTVLLFLCPFFSASAQDFKIKSNPENIGKGGIAIGRRVPDVTLTGIQNLRLNSKTISTAKLSEFAGKLLILDFWATWCAPCRKMVPVMDSLQRAFGSRIVFLPVTYQKANMVAPVLAALQKIKPFDLPEVTGDVVLHKLFPHRALPHYVWIDGNGTVRAITEFGEVNAKNIRAMLAASAVPNAGLPALAEKKDLRIPYDRERPMFIGGNGGDGASVRYHAVLSGYVSGLPAALRVSDPQPGKPQSFAVRNVPFTWLCRLAFGEGGRWFPDARIKLLSRDSAQMTTKLVGQAYDAWQADGHGYCYELLVPPGVGDKAFGMIQQDLRMLFPQWSVSVETISTPCLALVRTGGADLLKSAGGNLVTEIGPYSCKLQNAHLSQLMMRLQTLYLQSYPLPVVDQTGYTGRVDLDFKGKLYDVSSLNTELAKYGLAFARRDAVVEMLVIRDTPAAAPLTQTITQ